MEKKKKYLIIAICGVIGIILGSTLAWYTWTSTNTDVTFTIGGMTITYDAGDDITGVGLRPVSTKEVGVENNYAIKKDITVSSSQTAYFSLYLNTEVFGTGLQHESLKWELYEESILLNSGNFESVTQGNTITLLSNLEINTQTRSLSLYIWIDGNMANPSTMQNQEYKFVLNADATDQKTVPIADHVMSLSQGEGWSENASGVFKTSEGDYRYVGANVDNYVSFNNDLYRIIGVFDEKTHGQTGQQLVKLIAANPLSANSWGVYTTTSAITTYSSYRNDWTGDTTGVKANLNVLLNDFFYTKEQVHATYGDCGEWTYFRNGNDYKTKNCSNIIGYGIDSSLQGYISDARWHLYGYTGPEYSKQNFYQCERGLSDDTTNCLMRGTTSEPSSAYEDAKIGLMYLSDYLYASSAFSSTDETTTPEQEQYKYGNQNWLYMGYEWTITLQGGSASYAFAVMPIGNFSTGNSYYGFVFRPSFYLKSNIYVTSGDGTKNKPYTIIIKE